MRKILGSFVCSHGALVQYEWKGGRAEYLSAHQLRQADYSCKATEPRTLWQRVAIVIALGDVDQPRKWIEKYNR